MKLVALIVIVCLINGSTAFFWSLFDDDNTAADQERGTNPTETQIGAATATTTTATEDEWDLGAIISGMYSKLEKAVDKIVEVVHELYEDDDDVPKRNETLAASNNAPQTIGSANNTPETTAGFNNIPQTMPVPNYKPEILSGLNNVLQAFGNKPATSTGAINNHEAVPVANNKPETVPVSNNILEIAAESELDTNASSNIKPENLAESNSKKPETGASASNNAIQGKLFSVIQSLKGNSENVVPASVEQ